MGSVTLKQNFKLSFGLKKMLFLDLRALQTAITMDLVLFFFLKIENSEFSRLSYFWSVV